MSRKRNAEIRQSGVLAGHLCSAGEKGEGWTFTYQPGYAGSPVSLTLPVRAEAYSFNSFPAFLEGLLPEGVQLEALLRKHKIDSHDAFRQLVTVGADMIGSLSVHEIEIPPQEGEA